MSPITPFVPKSSNRRKRGSRKFQNIPATSTIFYNLTKPQIKLVPVARVTPIARVEVNNIVASTVDIVEIDLTFEEAINQRTAAYLEENHPRFYESIVEIDLTVFSDSEN